MGAGGHKEGGSKPQFYAGKEGAFGLHIYGLRMEKRKSSKRRKGERYNVKGRERRVPSRSRF